MIVLFLFLIVPIVTYFWWNKKREHNLKLEQENLLQPNNLLMPGLKEFTLVM